MIIRAPIEFPLEGNPYYPLPPDYPDLTVEGQKLARINGVSLCANPQQNVVAWAFFKRYYLESQPDGMWYKPPYYPSPQCHYEYTRNIHAFARAVEVFPRSFAKTTLMLENILRWMYVRPFFKILIIKSVDDFVRADFVKLQMQVENNDRLLADFGALKPKRGGGIWSQSRMFLTNGVEIVGRSVTSKLLGFRPNIWFLDDAEFDPAMQITPTHLTEHLRYLLHNHLDPMLDAGCVGVMQGTLISRKALLYEAATVSEAEEPRWGFWSRHILPAKLPDGSLTWPEKFSEARLEERREALGSAAFAAQFLNDPGSETNHLLPIHPLLSQYVVDNPDVHAGTKPLLSHAEVVSWIRKPVDEADRIETEEIRRPLGEITNNMFRCILVDPARTETSTSDYSAIIVLGIENSRLYRDTVWVLDLWMDKVETSKLIDEIWRLAVKWRVRVVGVESLAVQGTFKDKVEGEFRYRSESEGWMPRVQKVDYRQDLKKSKAARIMGLTWRFEQHRIKLPRHLSRTYPFSALYEQISQFTADLKLLKHDDALDALSMFQWLVRPKGRYTERDEDTMPDVLTMIRNGEEYVPGTKTRLIDTVRPQDLPADVIRLIADKRRRDLGRGRPAPNMRPSRPRRMGFGIR